MIIVRYAVLAMHGNVYLVGACHKAEALNHKVNLGVAVELPRIRPLDVGVRAVAAHAVRAEQGDTKHEVVERLVRAHAHTDGKGLSRFKDVRGDAIGANKLDGKDLGFA